MTVRRVNLDVQFAGVSQRVPSETDFTRWVSAALPDSGEALSLGVRIVDEAESKQLNGSYRGKDYPTNVLSFPMDVDDETGATVLGDVVICEAMVRREAQDQGKSEQAHWAHLTVHGVLHLLGFDHENPAEAREMETREVEILASLGYQDPYVLP